MGTRGVFTFKAEHNSDDVHIYAQYDCYPTGARDYLKSAVESGKVWTLPRYENDEFAAGFIAANKESSGGFRIISSQDRYAGIEYVYEIEMKGDRLTLTAYEIFWNDETESEEKTLIVETPLDHFIKSNIADIVESDPENYDTKGNWIGPVANENGWTA